jgi:aminopeptidase N
MFRLPANRTMRPRILSTLVLALTLAAGGCSSAGRVGPAPAAVPAVVDPLSFSRPAEARVRHLALDLTADFDARRLVGSAVLTFDNPRGAKTLVLDTRDLDIRGVRSGDGASALAFRLGDEKERLGRALEIDIPAKATSVHVDYATSPGAAAIQWFTPEQTSGGKYPFLFTQSQAILARTWVPCQDTPSVRMTYEATIRVPRGLLALMSAENPQRVSDDGVYHFRMPQPVPSYLLALAVGDLEFRPFDARSGVYAERSMIERAAWELDNTPAMIAAAERLYGPYRWGRYDILVLPPSFPWGGMENPRLTFATPTIIAGDRSLVSLVAHELAHSWSGNLVTNATWADVWLNEGFTTYFEMRIMEAVYGREYSEMLAALSLQDLRETVAKAGAASPRTQLAIAPGTTVAPGTSTDVAYDKGYFFLRHCEETAGRERFDVFLHRYFEKHAFESVTTSMFVDEFERELVRGDEALDTRLGVDRWIYGAGVPDDIPTVHSTRLDAVDAELARLASGTPPEALATKGWSTHEWVRFLRNLPPPVDAARLGGLDGAFHFTSSGNAEILAVWLRLAVAASYEPAMPEVDSFLTTVGRVKYIQPIYGELAKTPAGLAKARSIFEKARAGYHPVTVGIIQRVLGAGDKRPQ